MPMSLRSVLPPNAKSARALEAVTGIFDLSVRRQASRILINRHHSRVGGLFGSIGLPMGDVRPLGDGGFVKPFSGGTIELLDFVNGPQGFQRYRAEVRFVGYRVDATDEDGDGDEPYFILGVAGANSPPVTTRTNVPDGFHVKKDNNVVLHMMVTNDAQPPFVLSVTGMDHDSGTPDEAADKVTRSLNDFSAKLTLALPLLGVSPQIGAYIQSFLNIFGGTAGDILSGLFGMGDDTVGQKAVHFFEYDTAMMEWRSPKALTHPHFTESHNVEIVLDNGDADGTYTAFFDVQLFNDRVTLVPPRP